MLISQSESSCPSSGRFLFREAAFSGDALNRALSNNDSPGLSDSESLSVAVSIAMPFALRRDEDDDEDAILKRFDSVFELNSFRFFDPVAFSFFVVTVFVVNFFIFDLSPLDDVDTVDATESARLSVSDLTFFGAAFFRFAGARFFRPFVPFKVQSVCIHSVTLHSVKK